MKFPRNLVEISEPTARRESVFKVNIRWKANTNIPINVMILKKVERCQKKSKLRIIRGEPLIFKACQSGEQTADESKPCSCNHMFIQPSTHCCRANNSDTMILRQFVVPQGKCQLMTSSNSSFSETPHQTLLNYEHVKNCYV